jgi:hypothetical protein
MIAAPLLAAAQLAAPTVYSSLPLHPGPARADALAVQQGERLALVDAGSPLRLVSLDDSTARAGGWTPERASANARRAAQDDKRQGVIGTYSLDRHGDTTMRTIGLYAVRGGALTAVGTVSG